MDLNKYLYKNIYCSKSYSRTLFAIFFHNSISRKESVLEKKTFLWTSKTDHHTKSYPDFSLGGTQIVEHSLEDKVHSLGGNIIQKTG